MRQQTLAILSSVIIAGPGIGCGGGSDRPVSQQPSRSTTIAMSDDQARVAMVNPEDDSLAIFRTADDTRVALLPVGNKPAAVVIAPDNQTAYVANRGDSTVVRISGIDSDSPRISATVSVGSEPSGLALSPTGGQLFVAEFAEGRISVVDTEKMVVASVIAGPDHPRALLVTNDRDDDDRDEMLVVPEFFGEATPDGEGRDVGRTGRIRLYRLSDLEPQPAITLAPFGSGFARGGVAGNPEVVASPNQLWSLSMNGSRLYVTSVSAAPEGPPRFDNNVFPIVYVADLATREEIRDPSGTTNLARKIYDALPNPSATSPRFVPGELSGIDFLENGVSYTVARAADVMTRLVFTDAASTVGSTQNTQIDLAGNDSIGKCQGPTGLAFKRDGQRAYVNCWLTGRLGVVDLATQALVATVESAPAPSSAEQKVVARGRRFYFTGRGRWSFAGQNGAKGGEGWSSCGSCHPDGLTDNMTWVFAAGPRQTTSQDGSFSHGPGPQRQRIFNWTAVNDEHHDFERNTRDVSGGLGAITTAPTLADCNQLDRETQVPLAVAGTPIGSLGTPLKGLADNPAVALCGHKDWDDIDSFVRSIRPPRALTFADSGAVARGRALFIEGRCASCHGGPGWSASRRFFTPSQNTNAALATTPFNPPAAFPTTPAPWSYPNGAVARTQISAQPAIPVADVTGPAEPQPIAIAEVACNLRNVGTFGAPGDVARTDLLERRPFQGNLVRAEGRAGYNIPSLYGLALGAPYLHHGQAPSLEELFSDARWDFHTSAGNANFSVTLANPDNLRALTAFLLGIDATTEEIEIPAGFDACPSVFP